MLPAPLSNWLKRTRTLVVVGLMSGSVALADPVAIEPFNYAVPGGLNGQSGGSGFASNAWTAVSGQASPGLASQL